MPFGSVTTGLGIKSSDADCYINVPQQYRGPNANFVNKAKKLLQQHPRIFAEILSIPRANTPIVKFFHIPTETNCDVTFKTPLGAQNSKLIAFLLHADPRLVPMAVAIKYWAKVHGFSGTGKLTNYALTMLIIFYLQQPPVSILPSVEWLQRDECDDVIVDHWNTGFMHKHELLPRSTNTSSISELLGGFFQYYSTFNFEEFIVCPYLGCPVKKEIFKDFNNLPLQFERYKRNIVQHGLLPLRFTSSICVQDPIELGHNVASPINSRLASDIKAFFKFAATAYDKEKLKNCLGFLKIILLQRPKLPRKGAPEFRMVMYPHILQCIRNSDWKAVVREVMMRMFVEICKITLSKVEEKPVPDAKKVKEKYAGTLTKAIWKRKQFSKLYSLMHLDFFKKQARITEEIMNVDKETFVLKFDLILSFSAENRNVVTSVKLIDGDAALFKEFGKFFLSMKDWYITLLKPFFNPQDKSQAGVENSIAVDKAESINDESIDDHKVTVDDTEGDDTGPENVVEPTELKSRNNDTKHTNDIDLSA